LLKTVLLIVRFAIGSMTNSEITSEASWENAQKWEASWWVGVANTYGEETKQLLYANRMGLRLFHDGKSPYNIDMKGTSVLDIGGGPVSLLLKCVNVRGKVVDPLEFPLWVYDRYELAGIEFEAGTGEEISENGWDECWIYNVLQHVKDPQKVVENAKKAGKLIRIFEWLDTVSNIGHPHILTEDALNEWLGGEGKAEKLKGEAHCYGTAYYGVFRGDGQNI